MLKDESVRIEESWSLLCITEEWCAGRRFESEASPRSEGQTETSGWVFSFCRSNQCNISRRPNAIPFVKGGAASEGSNFAGCVNAL